MPGKEKEDRKRNNRRGIPKAREAMDKFKMLIRSEVSVNLTNGYNASLTSREAGDLEDQMVKNNCPVRNVKYNRQSRTAVGHMQTVEYMISPFTKRHTISTALWCS